MAPSRVMTHARSSALLVVALMLFVAAWIMVNPPWGTIDEPAHFVKGLAAGRGALVGQHLPDAERSQSLALQKTPKARQRARFILSTARRVNVPASEASQIPSIPCFAQRRTL